MSDLAIKPGLSDPIDDYIAQQATASRTNANAARESIERQRQAQQAAVAAQSGSQEWWSPANILDKFWMDDFQKGPFSSDPNAKISPFGVDISLPGVAGQQAAWQQGVGDKVNAATTGITKAYDTLNQGMSWGLSAMPAGMATLDWDTAGQISVGQTAMADSARRQDGNPFNAVYNTVAAPVQNIAAGAIGLFDQGNPLNDPNFDVTKAGQRDAAFGSSALGRVASGTTDAAVSWFLDPLVVAGKGVKVFRFGSEMMGLRGVTNMQVTTPNVARWAASKVDSTLTKLDTGVELSRDEKRISSMADNIVKMRRGELENYYLFKDKSNPYRGDLVGVADQIDNKHDALVFIGAAMGDSKYIDRLRVEQHAAFDALARAKGVSGANEQYMLNVPGWMAPVIHANALESNVNAGSLIDDLTRRDSALRAALGVVDDAGGTPLLTSFGGRSVMGERIAGAWAAGKAHRDVRFLDRKEKLPEGQAPENIALTWDGRTIPANDVSVDRMLQEQRISAQEAARIRRSAAWFDETGPAGYEQVFQLSAGFRRVRLWSWINGQHASGYMHVRGSLVGTESMDELNAALSDAKSLKVDQTFVQGAKDVWLQAMRSGSPEARIEAVRNIERMAASRLAKQFGVDEDEMLQVYDVLDARRSQLLGTMKPRDGKGRAYGIDPEDNSTILLDPLFQSQLDIKIPMLDMRQLERTAKIMARPEYKGALQRSVAKDIGTNMLDEIAALWKASVLLRLGYTTRNVAEGWMRSWAVLGTMPGLAATGRLARNTVYRNRAFAKSTRLAKKFAERELEVEKGLQANGTAAHALREELAQVRAAGDQVRVAQIEGDLEQLDKAAQSLTNRLGILSDARVKFGKRKVNDRGAFTGQNAQMYRDLASNQQTVDTALRSRWAREAEQELDNTKWVKVQPTETQYPSELANAVKEMRNDQVAVMALEGADPATMAAWIRSESGRAYRREMRLTRAGAEAKATQVHDLAHSYLPTEAARSLAARGARKGRGSVPEGDALVAAIGDPSLLVPVHGREVKSALDRVGSMTANQFVHAPINAAFKWIGTIPETTLVRQPFYNTVWQRRVAQLTQIAREQGKELDDRLVASIEKNAHAYALTATNNTIYTITRYSNPAHLLRFVIPFFPAWENSMRVWLGIIARDPSVAARASMLWNLPNSLGMVVDKDGNKVSSDRLGFLNGSPNQYVVMPQFFAAAMQKVADSPLGNVPLLGDAARGYSQFGLKSAKGSFNVVAPGTSPWLPGFGPLVVAPVGYVLHDKPDTQAFLRRFLGDQVYQQIVPFGEASGNPLDAFLPPAAKKLLQLKQGEDNQDYLAVVDAMMQQEMVTWYKSGGDPATKPTLDEVRDKANNFYKFSILASLTLPMSVTRMSAYQPMVDKWNALKADPSMSYQQKIDAFTQKYGDEYLPLTVSTSRSLARDLDPTLETYDALSSNTSLVEQLAQLGPETVGIIGASAPPGQFDQGVYNYYLNSDLPGLPGEAIKAHPTAGGMQTQVESAAMWRAYNEGKARRDDALKQRGGLSIDTKANEDIKAQWRYFKKVAMANKYGSVWTISIDQHESKQPAFLEGIRLALKDEKFRSSKWGQSDLWQTIRTYMELRQKAEDAILAGNDTSLVNDQWDAVREQIRYTTLEFMDFFDSYLADDKLSIPVGVVAS